MRRRSALLVAFIAGTGWATPSRPLSADASTVERSRHAAARTAYVEPRLRAQSGELAVIVQAKATRTATVAVTRVGGRVVRELPIVHGVAARVDERHLATLAATAGIRAITQDAKVSVASTGSGDSGRAYPLRNVFNEESGVAAMRKATSMDGKGVTVALVDTGIQPSADLAGRVLPVTDDRTGQVSSCVNLSGENTCDDSYGHGTFIAGLIAGDGTLSQGALAGVAPRADLVSIKIAGANGAADVSNVLAGIQWAVSFRDRYHIRVLNLSLGTDSTQSYKVDPLNYAVERAWASGIVVVVSASNRGPAAHTVSKPGDDPFVITVGAVDDLATTSLSDDTLPNFSGRGPTAADGVAKPDIVAPGAHLLSLNATGSSIATRFPTSIPDFGGAYRRGSGTSMATAVVSGAVALLVQRQPAITPDRAKYVLANSTREVASRDVMAVGDGILDLEAATRFTAPGLANQGVERSNGRGALDASRGHVEMIASDPAHTLLSGTMQTAQLATWDPAGFVSGDWSAAGWYGSSWYASSWYGSSWYGSSWEGSSWYGSSWYGSVNGSSWYGSSWYGSSWYGAWD